MQKRNGESHEDFRARVNAADRKRYWQTTRQTIKNGEVVGEVQVPKREPFVPLPDSVYRRKSTLVDAEGNVIQTWHVQAPEAEAFSTWARAITDAALDELKPIEPRLQQPEAVFADLLNLIPVGDHHFGMLAWRPEVGASYDVEIAEDLLNKAGDELIHAGPACSVCVIALMGDYLHYDGWKALTPENRNLLDTDTRFPKMVRAAMRSARRLIETAKTRHGKVHVIVELGNHDTAAAVHIAEHLAVLYENDPQVTIDTSPAFFHYYEFGDVLLGTHHGHTVKLDKLPLVMASDRREAWGRTTFHHWYTGHVHHEEHRAYPGCTVETMNILPPADAYAHQLGYRPIRNMKSIVYHRKFGEVARYTVNPQMWEE